MKLKPQGRFEGSWLGRVVQSRAGVIASNWLFQGMRYMNIYEVSLKLILDALPALLLIWWFGLRDVGWIVISILVAHTANWVLNGHFFVLMRYVRPVPKTPGDFHRYVEALKGKAEGAAYIDGVAIYGSYCRGQLHEHSDLDVRVIVNRGFINGVAGALFCCKERFKAFFMAFPLDVYCCAGLKCLDRLRADEKPVVLLDRSGGLRDRYAETAS